MVSIEVKALYYYIWIADLVEISVFYFLLGLKTGIVLDSYSYPGQGSMYATKNL